jgi:hypothetical protein
MSSVVVCCYALSSILSWEASSWHGVGQGSPSPAAVVRSRASAALACALSVLDIVAIAQHVFQVCIHCSSTVSCYLAWLALMTVIGAKWHWGRDPTMHYHSGRIVASHRQAATRPLDVPGCKRVDPSAGGCFCMHRGHEGTSEHYTHVKESTQCPSPYAPPKHVPALSWCLFGHQDPWQAGEGGQVPCGLLLLQAQPGGSYRWPVPPVDSELAAAFPAAAAAADDDAASKCVVPARSLAHWSQQTWATPKPPAQATLASGAEFPQLGHTGAPTCGRWPARGGCKRGGMNEPALVGTSTADST